MCPFLSLIAVDHTDLDSLPDEESANSNGSPKHVANSQLFSPDVNSSDSMGNAELSTQSLSLPPSKHLPGRVGLPFTAW